jgi:chromosome segregation ATPase
MSFGSIPISTQTQEPTAFIVKSLSDALVALTKSIDDLKTDLDVKLQSIQQKITTFDISYKFQSNAINMHDSKISNVEDRIHSLELESVRMSGIERDVRHHSKEIDRMFNELTKSRETTKEALDSISKQISTLSSSQSNTSSRNAYIDKAIVTVLTSSITYLVIKVLG